MDKLSVDELLKPRYKVIADYPNSSNKVGDIIELPCEDWKYADEVLCLEDYFDAYENVFKRLAWYEERDIKDMPEYIKCEGAVRRLKGLSKNLELIELFDNPGEVEYEEHIYESKDGKGYELYFLNDCEPSTEAEYKSYRSPKVE